MSLRLFVGYFLALAACATLAFSASGPDPSAPSMATEADMIPLGFPSLPYPPAHVHPHKLTLKRVQMANAQ